MTISEFKEKLSGLNIATGAKKVALAVAITSALTLATAPAVYAAVPASNIVGDVQVTEDRAPIKEQDAKDIHGEFCQYDKNGNAIVDVEEIRKAIELSDALNGYYFDELYFTNTNKKEVLGLDIDSLYNDYLYALSRNRQENFCFNNMNSKPAIDAYITFSCGTVANGIKSELSERICAVLTDEGYEITAAPRLTVSNNKLYAVVGISTGIRVIELKGDQVPEIISLVGKVNAHYNTALNNIAGYSNKYESSFAYNGVDMYTGESVWLSFADDTKQENLEGALSLYESLSNDKAVVLECEDPTITYRPSRKEVQMLQNLGYTDIQARSARVSEATITLLDLSYTK